MFGCSGDSKKKKANCFYALLCALLSTFVVCISGLNFCSCTPVSISINQKPASLCTVITNNLKFQLQRTYFLHSVLLSRLNHVSFSQQCSFCTVGGQPCSVASPLHCTCESPHGQSGVFNWQLPQHRAH